MLTACNRQIEISNLFEKWLKVIAFTKNIWLIMLNFLKWRAYIEMGVMIVFLMMVFLFKPI